ncbi:MAG: subunit of succinyl-CoA:benzylsuccinate CoA-transferase [Actinomycetia bacterium]|nr:subunit of succinyl-CoA:benzylsuccinate CoA-transferase [Actinomycetes bacterium]
MSNSLLEGLVILDLGDDPAARAARVLGDLGAAVIRVVPPGSDSLAGTVGQAWTARSQVQELAADDPAFDQALRYADVVFDTPGATGVHHVDPGRAPQAVWVTITPFGATGPRAQWRASDLGVMAASANMFCTGDPDRAPVRCTEPTAYAHTGPEAAFAALSALWAGGAQHVDVSMQEVVLVANMTGPARFPKSGFRGSRRGANIGRTREIWPTKDGYVSFGLRGGKARVPSLSLLTNLVAGDDVPGAAALTERDWSEFSPNTATDDELAAIEAPVAEYFSRHTMRELYEIACETNMMLAPANTPPEIYASEQLASRGFFAPLAGIARFPHHFASIRHPEFAAETAPERPMGANADGEGGAWKGVRILEFGSGAAGPIATRYFVEHGATVLRVESRSRPDFLRVYSLGPDNPHGLEGAPMYDGLNVGKRNVTLNLKDPRAVELVRRLVMEWADAICENFAPRAMKGFGLDYDALTQIKPDLVMISACLNGQTGPHKDYPGFGGQGSALGGYNALTGWPDREPVGPHGTITDSLAPRYVAAALAAGLHYRRRTGKGVYFDVSQVETAMHALAPWLLDYEVNDVVRVRDGNRHAGAVPHGAFPCADEVGLNDRWVAIACWDDDDWAGLAQRIDIDDPGLATLAGREARVDEVEAMVAAWTAARSRADVANTLQADGIEAVPVADFGDLHDDPQLAHREHFVTNTHPFMGEGLYERNGFRLSGAPSGYDRAGPTLGQDNAWVLAELLGLSADDIAALEADGALE